jgi:hypothetical protein
LELVDASLRVLLGDGVPGRVERETAHRLVACRYPPSRPHYWMARGALVLARFVDRHGDDPPMLPVTAARALSHALDPPGAPDSVLDQIRAELVLHNVELWVTYFAPRPNH